MKPSFNLDILKHTSVSGNSINNLLTLFHAMETEGTYHGTILQDKKIFSGFTVECSKDAKKDLLHIDLSLFDQLHAMELKQLHYRNPLFHIQPHGVLLFFVSGKHSNLSITINGLKDKKEPEFNSSYLGKKDKAAVRLFQFGEYELRDAVNKNKMVVEVVKKQGEGFSKTGSAPAKVKHSEKGFEIGTIKVHAGQLLLIDSVAEISVELSKAEKKQKSES
jgi:hypothetical protein